MIRSFKDKETERIFLGMFSRKFPVDIQQRVNTCLERIHAASSPQDLAFHKSLRLKRLSGDRKGQYSIRVNKQYRVCFGWIDRYAVNVELTDYH